MNQGYSPNQRDLGTMANTGAKESNMKQIGSALLYSPNKILGVGGFGKVFLGAIMSSVESEDREQTPAAVKRVLLEHVHKREAEALKILMNHPNVIKIYHTVEDEDFKYFALELCAASMDDIFLPDDNQKKYKGPLPSDLDAILQLSEGMQYIHENGFVHRDVKPGNVLISYPSLKDGEVSLKWSDFGLSKPVSTQKTFSVSGLRGTMNWIAPEILEIIDQVLDDGSHVSHGTVKSDIWSAGCVIFAYLTKGKHPFGKNSMEIITNMRYSKPINLQEFPKDHFAMNLIREMIAKDPAKRKKLVEVIEILSNFKEETKRRMHAIMRPELETGVVYHWNQWSLAVDWSKLYVWSDDVAIMGIPTRAGYVSEINCILDNFNIKLNLLGRSVTAIRDLNNEGLGREKEGDLNTKMLEIVKIVPGTPGELLFKANGVSSKVVIPVGDGWSICQVKNDLVLVKRSQKEIQEVDDIQVLLAESTQIKLHGSWFSSGFHFLANAEGEWQVLISDTAKRALEKELLDLCALSTPDESQLDRVEEILQVGIDPNHFEGLNGQTPLLLCLRNQDGETRLNCLKKLLEGNQKRSKGTIPRQVDLYVRDRQEKNAFHALLEKQSDYNHVIYEALEVLVKNGIDVNMKDQDGRNSLHLLCLHYRKENIVDAMKLLVANGVDVKSRDNLGNSALHFLCDNYYKDNISDAIQYWIDSGVGDVNLANNEGCTALHLLCWSCRNENTVGAMKLLIDSGSDINLKNKDECTALHRLLLYDREEDCLESMKLLIECGIDVNLTDNYGRTALHKLLNNYKHDNFFDAMKLLINSGINVNLKDEDGDNAMHYLCWFYHRENIVDAIKLLIDKDIDVKSATKDGWTALHFLCYHYKLETIVDAMKLLIDSGADVGVKNEHGSTALHHLCRNYGNENIMDGMKLLIDNGADVNSISNYGRTALHLLCENYRNENLVDTMKLLIEGGIDVTLKGADSCTALHYLCGNYKKDNLIDGITLIIDSCINVNLQDRNGWTALLNLCSSYRNANLVDAMKLLIEKGADVKLQEKDGRNALHLLCATAEDNYLVDGIKLLINQGIDVVNLQDSKNGWSALHYLCKGFGNDGITDGMKLLIEAGIDVNLKDKDGRTALHWLCGWTYQHDNFIEPFKLLVDSEIDVQARDDQGRTALDILARDPDKNKFKVKIHEEILTPET